MGGYRLYFMDRFSGHIDHRRDFLADDDSTAIAVASDWMTGQPMELWQGGRKLKRWEDSPPTAEDSGSSPSSLDA